MAESPTLNSRLRVLVAKTFRAEKLYSSMKQSSGSEQGEFVKLAEIANGVRADVWQASHGKLRKQLNDLLSSSNAKGLVDEVTAIRNSFQKNALDSKTTLGRVKLTLVDMANKDEFAHTLKLSLELIRLKAQSQANQIIADELTAVIQSSRKEDKSLPEQRVMELSACDIHEDYEHSMRSNVIPFKRKAS